MSYVVTDYNEYRPDFEESYKEESVADLATRIEDLTGMARAESQEVATEIAERLAPSEEWQWGDPEKIGRIVTARKVGA
jgi:hypothetical protein